VRVREFKRMANKVQPEWLKPDTDMDTIERKFWKTMSIGPPLYGADTPGMDLSHHRCLITIQAAITYTCMGYE
jgi:hypothetical protein